MPSVGNKFLYIMHLLPRNERRLWFIAFPEQILARQNPAGKLQSLATDMP